MAKKNTILLVVAIILFFVALAFLGYTTSLKNGEEFDLSVDDSKTNISAIEQISTDQSDVDDEAVVVDKEKEVSNTKDIEGVTYTDIKVYGNDKEEVNLSQFSDSSIMLLFWNPENSDSVKVLKMIDSEYENYKDTVKFLMISTSEEIPEELKSEISMDIYYDLDKEYETKFKVKEIPAAIYIYKDNTIKNAKSGIPSTDALEANLDILADNI